MENHISQSDSLSMGMSVMSKKLTLAVGLSFVGGVCFLLGIMLYLTSGSVGGFLFFGDGFLLYMYLILGIVITGASLMMNSNPNRARILGTLILGLGVVSLLGAITKLRVFLTLVTIPWIGDVTSSVALALTFVGGVLSVVAGGLAVFCAWRGNASIGNQDASD